MEGLAAAERTKGAPCLSASSHQYSTVEEAVATRTALHGVKWPQSNPKFLCADYAEQDEVRRLRRGGGWMGQGGQHRSWDLSHPQVPPLYPGLASLVGNDVIHISLSLYPQLDYHRGLLVDRPSEAKTEEQGAPRPLHPPPPPPVQPPPHPRAEPREQERAVREQWAEREREMERRERTRSEREWDRDKVREGPRSRSRSRDRRRKERAKSKEKKSEKKGT